MKKVFITLLFFLLLPSLCSSAFIIHLKNGSKFKTTSYWKEGHSVKFIYKGGELGLDKSLISSIEHTEDILVSDEPGAREVLPEKPKKQPEKNSVKPKKKSSKKSKKQKSMQKRFNYLKEQFGTIKKMSPRRAISLINKLMNFSEVVFREQLGDDFDKEIQEVYSMADAIEEELNSRNQ